MNAQQKWTAFSTVAYKEMQRVFRIWPQTLLPSAITSILYFVIFGHVIGRHVGKIGGYDYAAFIAPGLIMMQMITSAFSASATSFFRSKFMRQIEELLVSPMPNLLILLGYISGGILRGLLVGLIVTLIALCFTDMPFYHVFDIIIVGLLSTAIFSLGGILNAVYARKFDDVSIVPTFVLTPLTYFGGVFYMISALPSFWQKASFVNPIFHIITLFRYGFLNVNNGELGLAMVLVAGLFIALLIATLAVFKSGAGLRS